MPSGDINPGEQSPEGIYTDIYTGTQAYIQTDIDTATDTIRYDA